MSAKAPKPIPLSLDGTDHINRTTILECKVVEMVVVSTHEKNGYTETFYDKKGQRVFVLHHPRSE
jgi:hypothetical protein